MDFLKSTYLELCQAANEPLGSLKIYEQLVGAFKNRMYSKLPSFINMVVPH